LEIKEVLKRGGYREKFSPEKVNTVVEWACEGTEANPSAILMAASYKLDTLPTTKDIHQALIKAAVDLSTEVEPEYLTPAARLNIFDMRKCAYGMYEPPKLYNLIVSNIEEGYYDPEILKKYTWEEITLLDEYIDHNKDLEYSYAATVQWREKYLVQNRVTKELRESPQIAIMLIGMCLHQNEPEEDRLNYIIDFYEEVSQGRLSLPTPIMGGVRTPTRQFSSCCLIESGDSLKSINAASSAIVEYISKRAGIGINGGAIRALGSSIRNGSAVHTGVVPFYRHFYTAVKSCSQG
jgi:ribonucleoside-diphosphate reductase alpha chain